MIREKLFVRLNGTKIGMMMEGPGLGYPVMMFVHGGPGMPEYFLATKTMKPFFARMNVVFWDQRGAGLSCPADREDTISTSQYVEDTIAVAAFLKKRYGVQGVYLMAHSWGTYFAIRAAAKKPEHFLAYIAMAQITDQVESERRAYEYMLIHFREKEDRRAVRVLEKHLPTSKSYQKYRDSLMHRAGIGTLRNMRSVIRGIFLESLLCNAYTPSERIRLWCGKAHLTGHPRLRMDEDVSKVITSLEIPVCFLCGESDYTVNHEMSEAYFRRLQAPRKCFHRIADTAHSPVFEKPEEVLRLLEDDMILS